MPRRFLARRKYQAAARSSGSRSGSRTSANCHQPCLSRPASAARSSAESAIEFSDLRSRSSQRAKSGAGDSVTKVCMLRIVAADLLHHLLDQEAAERHAGEPALAVRDRIEHRRRRLVGRRVVALHREDRRDGVGNLAGQRDLDEDQRLVDQRRMEEGVAAPVRRIDAAAQVVPAPDAVHRLVADDLFQDHRRASTSRCAAAPGSRG